MGKQIPSSAHRRQWEESFTHSSYEDIDPDQITDGAQVDDDSDSEPELSAQEVRRRRHARRSAIADDENMMEKVSRSELQQVLNDDYLSGRSNSDLNAREDEDLSVGEDDDQQSEADDVEDITTEEKDHHEDDGSASLRLPVLASSSDAAIALAALEREGTTFLLNSARSEKQDEARAVALRHQKRMYESALDLRMSLQKPLQIVGRFPYGDQHVDLCSQFTDIADAFRASADILSDVLTDLMKLELGLLNKHGVCGTVEDRPMVKNSKRHRPDLDLIWQDIDARFEGTRFCRESTIDYWNRRMQISSGGHVLHKKKFKALNQSIMSQIQTNLADMEPLRQRAFMNKNQVTVVGAVQAAEVFDDSGFYHQLLKELISSACDQTAAGRVSRRSSDRGGKVVDRRASKGRKLRFVVHEKIVNFMAPCAREASFDYDVDHLFTHLFST